MHAIEAEMCVFPCQVLIMLLMPYVGISLYTADKTMYIADASAKRYRASAYYIAKVRHTVAQGTVTLYHRAMYAQAL